MFARASRLMVLALIPALMVTGCGREKPVQTPPAADKTPSPTPVPPVAESPARRTIPAGIVPTPAVDDNYSTMAEQAAIDASVTSGLPSRRIFFQTNPVTSTPTTAPLLLTTWLDDGSTLSEDSIPEVAERPDPEPGEGPSVGLFLYDRKNRTGAAGVELEPFDDDALPRRLIVTNSEGVAYIRFKKGVEPRSVRLKVLGNWLPVEPNGAVEIKRAELLDLILTVPVRNDGKPSRLDVYPAVEVAVGLVEGRQFFSVAPITWAPVDAIAVNTLTYVPDNSEANFPRIRVPARLGDKYSLSVGESYISEARQLLEFTITDVSKPQFFTVDMVLKTVTEGLPK
jgi:hypothetical protein